MANYKKVAARKARKHHINPALFLAQINAESGFNPRAKSPAGAEGIAQFMPGTAAGMGVDPWRPKQALEGAARLMESYVKEFGSYEKALRAYNAGGGAVQASYGYPETNAYVKSILAHRNDPVPGGKGGSNPMAEALRQRVGGKTSVSFQPASFDSKTQIDQAGYEKARKQAVLGAFLAMRRPNSLLARLLPQQMPNIADFTQTSESFNPAKASVKTTPGKQPNMQGSGQQMGGPVGKVTISPGADRPGVSTRPKLIKFAKLLSGKLGEKLTIGTGTAHSQMTTSGNVSDHWDGHAVDIPLAGHELTRAGHKALILAGMSPAQARKATGGIYNINGYQIIFNTTEGGNHWNHLHVGFRKGR